MNILLNKLINLIGDIFQPEMKYKTDKKSRERLKSKLNPNHVTLISFIVLMLVFFTDGIGNSISLLYSSFGIILFLPVILFSEFKLRHKGAYFQESYVKVNTILWISGVLIVCIGGLTGYIYEQNELVTNSQILLIVYVIFLFINFIYVPVFSYLEKRINLNKLILICLLISFVWFLVDFFIFRNKESDFIKYSIITEFLVLGIVFLKFKISDKEVNK